MLLELDSEQFLGNYEQLSQLIGYVMIVGYVLVQLT